MSDTDKKYWAEYDGLQYTKHTILKKYLGGWFPILASYSGRVLYIDSHAGRGRHLTGHVGSPIIALKRLINHTFIDRILNNSEVRFLFFEINETHVKNLKHEVKKLSPLPDEIIVEYYPNDYEIILRSKLKDLKSQNMQLAPSFCFIDPYGFKLSMELLNILLSFDKCELLINLMFRYIDMAIYNDLQETNMDILFGIKSWRDLRLIKDPSERAEKTIKLFSTQLKSQYTTHMYMRDSHNALKYVLIHASNHKKGKELMKESMWSVCPDGSFTAFERNKPDQFVLISPNPDLKGLEKIIWKTFSGKTVKIYEIYDWLVDELYLKKHLHKVLKQYWKNEKIKVTNYKRRYSFKDTVISFPNQ